jgi:hypothetical protein
MEAGGYAAALADVSGETVRRVQFYPDDDNPPVRFTADGVMEVRDADGSWVSVRACFRYVTQAPWDRIPLVTKTLIHNPIIACLAGGRNKSR